jgi:hypothetical protein
MLSGKLTATANSIPATTATTTSTAIRSKSARPSPACLKRLVSRLSMSSRARFAGLHHGAIRVALDPRARRRNCHDPGSQGRPAGAGERIGAAAVVAGDDEPELRRSTSNASSPSSISAGSLTHAQQRSQLGRANA